MSKTRLSHLILAAALTQAPPFGAARADSSERIHVEPIGIDAPSARALERILLNSSEARARLRTSRHRVIWREIVEPGDKEAQGGKGRMELGVYDYTSNRLVRIATDMDRISPKIRVSEDQPPPSGEEIEEAIAILRSDANFGPSRGEWRPYSAMPYVVLPEAGNDRILPIGLLPAGARAWKHEIVGVNLSRGIVLRYPTGAPPKALARHGTCAVPGAGQPITPRGTPGRGAVTVVADDGTELWRFTVIRPAASSGFFGSGVELRDVFYREKKVLSHLHVPILNVRYENDVCGPFRDVQFQEGMFSAQGTPVSQGFLRAEAPPSTIFESEQDVGNYRGVAIHDTGSETVLVSELEAGWYRYKSEIRFHDDGTLQPLWGFAGVESSCTCKPHHHHAYFRMDFEIGDSEHNQAQVFDGSGWKPIPQETRFQRDASHQQWRVLDPALGSGYVIVPGPHDGSADEFGKGDVWALKFAQGQLDDSRYTRDAPALIDLFGNSESIESADVVLWYSGHFRHVSDDFRRGSNQVVGPRLVPFQW